MNTPQNNVPMNNQNPQQFQGFPNQQTQNPYPNLNSQYMNTPQNNNFSKPINLGIQPNPQPNPYQGNYTAPAQQFKNMSISKF